MTGSDWNGRDPRLRGLRTWAIILISGLLVWTIVLDANPHDLGVIGTLTGALLVLLGYEAGQRRLLGGDDDDDR
jgi:hypothetical protein